MTLTAMDFEDVVGKRKMVRRYKQNMPLSEKTITKLIRNAHRAPSAGHTQVQEFIIVKEPAIKKKLRAAAVDEGIGACFVGAFDDAKVSKILNIPAQVRPIGIICIGCPDEEPARIGRIALSHLVYYDKYGNTNRTVDAR